MVRAELFCILVCLFLVQVCADTLYLKNAKHSGSKKVENVTIVKDDYREITYKDKKGRRIPLELENVEWIEYSIASFDFNDGVKAIHRENYGDAIFFLRRSLKGLERATPGKMTDRLYAQNLYYLGRAYQLSAESGALNKRKYRNVIKYYKKAIEADKYTRFLRECYFYSAQCHLALKEYDQARNSLTSLRNTLSGSKDKIWTFRTYMWQGNIAVQKKEYGKAIEKYTRAQNAGNGDQKAKARLAAGKCYIEQKKFDKAVEVFEKMNSKGTPDIRAAAKNGLASCYLAQGKYREARRVAIEVVLEYQKAEQRQPEALFLAATCYEKLDKREQGSLQRALTYYRLVKLGYPNTPWARKAISRLDELADR